MVALLVSGVPKSPFVTGHLIVELPFTVPVVVMVTHLGMAVTVEVSHCTLAVIVCCDTGALAGPIVPQKYVGRPTQFASSAPPEYAGLISPVVGSSSVADSLAYRASIAGVVTWLFGPGGVFSFGTHSQGWYTSRPTAAHRFSMYVLAFVFVMSQPTPHHQPLSPSR